ARAAVGFLRVRTRVARSVRPRPIFGNAGVTRAQALTNATLAASRLLHRRSPTRQRRAISHQLFFERARGRAWEACLWGGDAMLRAQPDRARRSRAFRRRSISDQRPVTRAQAFTNATLAASRPLHGRAPTPPLSQAHWAAPP